MENVEVQSFLELARVCLKTEDLPDSIRIPLNTIFAKKSGANLYRPKIVCEKTKGIPQNKHPILKGRRNSVRNILCIWYLLNGDTKKTKEFLQSYAKSGMTEKYDQELLELANQQYLEFFCLGVVRENVYEIIEALNSSEFDLFRDKLPSPFFSNQNDPSDISPILTAYSQVIPWEDYMGRYEEAEHFFGDKQYEKAKEVLHKLEEDAVIRLPVVEALNKKIKAIEAEAEEAWNYFQKMLN